MYKIKSPPYPQIASADSSLDQDGNQSGMPHVAQNLSDKYQLIDGFKQPTKYFAQLATIPQLFEEQAAKVPNNKAVGYEDKVLTYEDLNQCANKLAHWLQEHGIRCGDTVALLFEPSIEFIILVIAITKVGGIYLALDIQTPCNRLGYIINDSQAKIVISNLPNKSPYLSLHPIYYQWENIAPGLNYYSVVFDSVKQTPTAPICLFYTSGTTGTPKGVMISHQAVVNLSKATNSCKIEQSDIVGQFYNLASDPFTMEIWDTLLNGAMLLVIPPRIKKNNQHFKRFLVQNKVTCIILPTSYFHHLTRTALDTLDSLRTILFGGEAINIELTKKFLRYRRTAKLPVTLINAYGPTEATTVSCYKTFDLTTPENELVASIGKPISNVKTYVLDKNLQPVKPGEIGELYISGINLAINYLNSPLNNEKFTLNPFCENNPFKLRYKTGDLVRELPNGELQYVARIDDQVKISGYRVHLSEIETHLLKYPGISDAFVLAEKRKNNLHSIVAYVVVSDLGIEIHAHELAQFLKFSLPRYMLPKKYVRIEQIPLKNNGKIDKEQLKNVPSITIF